MFQLRFNLVELMDLVYSSVVELNTIRPHVIERELFLSIVKKLPEFKR